MARGVIETGQAVHDAENVSNKFTGHAFSLSISPVFGSDGGIDGVVTVAQDITARSKMETELRESEARMSDFAEASAGHFWQTDAQHRYTYFSQSYQNSFDQPIDILLGQPVANATDLKFPHQETWRYVQNQMERRQPFRDVVF